MICYPGYNELIQKVYDHNQEHVFEYWSSLDESEKKELLDGLKDIDFELLLELFSLKERSRDKHFVPAPCINLPRTEEEREEYRRAGEIGAAYIRSGKTAAFVVAGGQGSRLGYDGPKGMLPIGPVSNSTLFQIHAEKILKYSRKYNTTIPFLIMTSRSNHEETENFFRQHDFFGLRQDDVVIFPQNMVPSLDMDGRLILETRKSIYKNPDGHGGSLTALHSSGALAALKERGIETVSYFQVDNPLVKIIDPVFIGFHLMRGADVSSKAVKKSFPEEKVGVFVKFSDNSIGVVEYSDFPRDMLYSTDNAGDLRFSSGSVAIHLFKIGFIERITTGKDVSLPYHIARKKIAALKGGRIREIDGLKFERYVFDALPLTEKDLVFEVPREEEFAPVKNATGVDSIESAQKLMRELHRKWLSVRGIRIPGKTKIIEISPLVAVAPDDIDAGLVLPNRDRVYLS